MRTLLMGVFLSFLSLSSLADDGPFGVKRFVLGANYDDIASDATLRCSKGGAEPRAGFCMFGSSYGETIAGVSIVNAQLNFLDGKLAYIVIYFHSARAGDVAYALIEKWGPSERQTEILQTRGGAKIPNHVYHWERPDSKMELNSIAGTVDSANLRIYTMAHREYQREEFLRKAKRGAKDL